MFCLLLQPWKSMTLALRRALLSYKSRASVLHVYDLLTEVFYSEFENENPLTMVLHCKMHLVQFRIELTERCFELSGSLCFSRSAVTAPRVKLALAFSFLIVFLPFTAILEVACVV